MSEKKKVLPIRIKRKLSYVLRPDGVVQINSSRNVPPLAKGMASALLLRKACGNSLGIVGAKNQDGKKAPLVGLVGGRRTYYEDGTHVLERLTTTVSKEVLEEAGVLGLDATTRDFAPICRVIKKERNYRDENDDETGKTGFVDQFVFAHFGDLELHETTDPDIEWASWFTLDGILKDPDAWFPSHIAVIIQSVQIIGDRFWAYCNGKITKGEPDYPFYQGLARAIGEDMGFRDTMFGLSRLNVIDYMLKMRRFRGDLRKLRKELENFTFYELDLPHFEYHDNE